MEIGSEEKKNKKVDDAFHDADIDEHEPNGDKDNDKMATNGGDSYDDEVIGDDDDATAVKLKSKVHDEQDYDEAAVEEERKDASDVDSDVEEMDAENGANDEEAATEKEDVIAGLESNEFSQQYRTDKENHLWCELSFDLNTTYKNVDLSIVLKEVARKSVIVEVPHIRRAITYNRDFSLFLCLHVCHPHWMRQILTNFDFIHICVRPSAFTILFWLDSCVRVYLWSSRIPKQCPYTLAASFAGTDLIYTLL